MLKNHVPGKHSDETPSSVKNDNRDRFGKCCVCNKTDHITMAHILPFRNTCKKLGVDFDVTNFIPLCGTLGQRGTCHDMFDRNLMGFVINGRHRKEDLDSLHTRRRGNL